MEIEPPKKCPCCNYPVEWENDIIYCKNKDCPGQVEKRLNHWVKTLKIKGLGPKTIENLNISSIEELYDLTEEELSIATGSSKLASKIITEIENSKKASLNKVIAASSIPLVGIVAANKICSVIRNLNELNHTKLKEAGLGPKAIENILNWYVTEYANNQEFYNQFYVYAEEKQKTKGDTICISGKLKSVKSKNEAEELLKNKGYEVKSSLTKDVTILLNESGIESSKTEKARESGVPIITNLNQLLKEN